MSQQTTTTSHNKKRGVQRNGGQLSKYLSLTARVICFLVNYSLLVNKDFDLQSLESICRMSLYKKPLPSSDWLFCWLPRCSLAHTVVSHYLTTVRAAGNQMKPYFWPSGSAGVLPVTERRSCELPGGPFISSPAALVLMNTSGSETRQ